MEKKLALAAVSVAALFIAGSYAVIRMNDPEEALAACGAGAIGSTLGGPFELVNKDGQTVTDADVITQPSLIYFGYTFCPDICPTDSLRNGQAVQLLEDKGIMVTPVFITIDPERDTPERVGEFAYNFHDRMIGLTGSADQIKAASRAYATYYAKGEVYAEGDYAMDHSIQSYFNIPGYGVVDYYGREESPEQVAARMECLIDAVGAN